MTKSKYISKGHAISKRYTAIYGGQMGHGQISRLVKWEYVLFILISLNRSTFNQRLGALRHRVVFPVLWYLNLLSYYIYTSGFRALKIGNLKRWINFCPLTKKSLKFTNNYIAISNLFIVIFLFLRHQAIHSLNKATKVSKWRGLNVRTQPTALSMVSHIISLKKELGKLYFLDWTLSRQYWWVSLLLLSQYQLF